MKYLIALLAILAVAQVAEANGRQRVRVQRQRVVVQQVVVRQHRHNVQAVVVQPFHAQQFRVQQVVAPVYSQQFNACHDGALQFNSGYGSQAVILQQNVGCRQFLRAH